MIPCFTMIKRIYEDLEKLIKPNKVLVIYGPRRVGKTTILNNYLVSTPWKYKLDSGDNIEIQHKLSSQEFKQIIPYAEGYELIAIDEAQHIPNIGMGLKILVDQLPGLRIIATGSSSFNLANQVGEPLVGRKRTITLYPISQLELLDRHNRYELKGKAEDFLVFGSYPDVVTAKTRREKVNILQEIVTSYLFNDILDFDRVKASRALVDLTKLLAFQIGNEVSLNELSRNLGIDVKTVGRYLDLLEKAFIIVSVGGLRRNLRREVTSKRKYYFLDNGVRNGLISQFNTFDKRDDVGQLWENFIFMERLKKRHYKNIHGNIYFWRTHEGQEIDMVEERDGNYFGFECKWSEKQKIKIPRLWKENYPQAGFKVITPENYLEFVA
ncbi:MAG: hypothetical protein ACD_12C00217G0001 [uncultured bacterium]|nr:MAG: hypothetical protein ACD_12C00217G0001 [uncultured bacterium]